MLVGVCENCRYTDLIENPESICPRCGGRILSLGVGSALWNRMTHPDKTALINRAFPRHEEVPETDGMLPETDGMPPETNEMPPAEEIKQEEEIPAPANDTDSDSIPEEEETGECGEAAVPDDIPVPDDTAAPVAFTADNDVQFNEKLHEFVYVCYKCDAITSHESDTAKYFCSECGSDMIWTGFTTYEWGKLSIRAKRNATDNSKIRYIESRIKKTDFKSS